MTEQTRTEETVSNGRTEAKEQSNKGQKTGFRIPGMNAGREVAQQLIRPWFDATATTLEQVHHLQQRLLTKTQDAMRETYEFLHEGMGQCANVSQRTHQAMQDQLKRFGSR